MTSRNGLGRASRALVGALAALTLAVNSAATPALADDTVPVPDSGLRTCVAKALESAGLPSELSAANLARLETLQCFAEGIANLTGVEHLTGLRTLIAYGSTISDLRPLTGLPELWHLQVETTSTLDLTPAESLPSLTKLLVSLQQDTDAAPIGRLHRLERLYLDTDLTRLPQVEVPSSVQQLSIGGGSRLVDVSGIVGGAGVRKLSVSGSRLTSLDGLEGLTSVDDLSCSSTDLTDLSAVSGMTGLTRLYLASNNLSDLSPLRDLTRLEKLNLWDNRISDVTSLAGLTGLTELFLQQNQISDAAALSGLSRLTYLDLDQNNLTTLAPLASLPELTTLLARYNQITDLGPDGGLAHLTYAGLSGNGITDIAALRGAKLTTVGLSRNQVSDLGPLAGIEPTATVQLSDNHIRDFSPLPDAVNLIPGSQSIADPAATVGRPTDLGIRDLTGKPICPSFSPAASCADGMVTYPRSGTYTGSVSAEANSGQALRITQYAGPSRQFTKTYAPKLYSWPRVGMSLAAETKAWTPKVDHFTYQWYRDGKQITGPESDGYYYLTAAADRGHRISACVTGHLDGYAATRRCSARTAAAAIGEINYTPKPKVTGTPITDALLTAVTGAWDQGVSFKYQWQRNGKSIKGQTGATFRVRSSDVAESIRVRVTGTKAGCRSATRYSAAVRPKRATFTTAVPQVFGSTTVGQSLTVDTGTWTPAPSRFSYQWYRGTAAVKGATRAAYPLTAKDLGKTIKVKVTATRSGYTTAWRYSVPTVVVT